MSESETFFCFFFEPEWQKRMRGKSGKARRARQLTMEMESLLREPTQERVKRTLFDQNLANKPLPRTTDLLASNESVKTNADSRRPPSSATSTTTKETVSDRRCPSLCE